MFSHSGKHRFELARELAARRTAAATPGCVAVLRQMLPQLVQQHVGAPEEHARSSSKIAGRDVRLRLRQLRLFVESAHRRRARARPAACLAEIRCSRSPSPASAAGSRPPSACRSAAPLSAAFTTFRIRGRLADHVVRRETRPSPHPDRSSAGSAPPGRSPAPCCAARARPESAACGISGQLLDDVVAQMVVGQHPQALGRNHRRQPVHRRLNQDAVADHVQHLLGGALAAARPEARAAPAGQDQAVMMLDSSTSSG